VRFEWDEDKAAKNLKDHGVSFYEAREVFYDPRLVEFYDADHSTLVEVRYNAIGFSSRRLLFVIFTMPSENVIRIISARKAGKKHRRIYESKRW
jgi:hypothetical protein